MVVGGNQLRLECEKNTGKRIRACLNNHAAILVDAVITGELTIRRVALVHVNIMNAAIRVELDVGGPGVAAGKSRAKGKHRAVVALGNFHFLRNKILQIVVGTAQRMRQGPHGRDVEDRFAQIVQKRRAALRRESLGDLRQLGNEPVIHQRIDDRKKHLRAVGGLHVHRHAPTVRGGLDDDLKMRAGAIILTPEINNRTS